MDDIRRLFNVETENGEIKEAELLNVFSNNDTEYAVYSIDNGNNTSQLYASKIVIDKNGNTTLMDIENNKEKESIIQLIKDQLTDER